MFGGDSFSRGNFLRSEQSLILIFPHFFPNNFGFTPIPIKMELFFFSPGNYRWSKQLKRTSTLSISSQVIKVKSSTKCKIITMRPSQIEIPCIWQFNLAAPMIRWIESSVKSTTQNWYQLTMIQVASLEFKPIINFNIETSLLSQG